MSDPAKKPYRKRYRPRALRSIRVTEDDDAIMRHVYRHRFLTSNHIRDLLPHRSRRMLGERLLELTAAKYLDRPVQQEIVRRELQKNVPFVYALGDGGADYLERHHGIARGKVRWQEKNRQVGRENIRHTLGTSDVMVAFEVAFRCHDTYRFVHKETVLETATETIKRSANPFVQAAYAQLDGERVRLPVAPDGVFGYDLPDGKRVVCLLEADRATMTLLPKTLKGSSIFKKWLGYHRAFTTGEIKKWWPADEYLVLTVTSSEERIKNMCAVLDRAKDTVQSKRGNNFFLFAEADTLTPETVLTMPWLGGKGKSFYIVN